MSRPWRMRRHKDVAWYLIAAYCYANKMFGKSGGF